MIGIRVDANSIIATGHMMRCMTIAKVITSLGGSVMFFVADSESQKLLNNLIEPDMKTCVLNTDYKHMEDEVKKLISLLENYDIRTLLVDSYNVTYNYFEKLKPICRIAYLDDLLAGVYPVDLIINYSGYSFQMGYEEKYESEGLKAKMLLGLKYAPLRKQFYENRSDLSKKFYSNDDTVNKSEVKDILLATGGADICGMILPTLKKAEESSLSQNITWNVVVGDYVENADEIEEYVVSHNNIRIHRSVKNMAQLMKSCQIAVLAAGTMLTECAALGLPAVFYQVADNQKFNVSYFEKTGGMFFAGDVTKGEAAKDKVIRNIIKEIGEIISNDIKRYEMSDKLRSITDGRGAVRIAKALMELENEA